MNRTEAQQIATAINIARPDWPTGSIVTLLARDELRHRPAAHVAIALTAIAYDPDTRTPARLTQPGPWWDGAARATDSPSDTTQLPPRHHEQCDTHPGGRKGRCAGCRADQLAAPAPEPPGPIDLERYTSRVIRLRDRLANAWDRGHHSPDDTNPYRTTTRQEPEMPPHDDQQLASDPMEVGA